MVVGGLLLDWCGRMSLSAMCRRWLLNQSTHSILAISTSSRVLQGPWRRMSSVFNSPGGVGGVVRAGGELQLATDRLGPELGTVGVDEYHYRGVRPPQLLVLALQVSQPLRVERRASWSRDGLQCWSRTG